MAGVAAEERRELDIELAATERMMFFSDAVVAIALTLLALDLPLPNEGTGSQTQRALNMLHAMRDHDNEYLAFVISFLVIAAHWRLHHRIFRYVSKTTQPMIRLNLLWLLLIVITPFTTRLLSVGNINILRFGVYAATQALQFLVFTWLVELIIRGEHVHAGTDVASLRRTLLISIPMAIGFAISIPAYVLVGQWAYFLWAAWVVFGPIHRRWTGRTAIAAR